VVRRRDRSAAVGPRPRVAKANLQAGFLIRIFVLAIAAVIGSAWALVRYYTRTRPAMAVPAAAERTSDDGGARLIPAPEIELEKP